MDILKFSKALTHDFGQNWEFHLSLFLDKMSVEVMSDDHPSRKLALLPNCIFSKGLTHDFRQKLQISCLLICFLDNGGLKIMFADHLVRDQALLHYKNVDFT